MNLFTRRFTTQPKNWQINKKHAHPLGTFRTGVFLGVFFCVQILLSGCNARKKDPLIIWTDIPEFASYAELFNIQHQDAKALVIYKKEPARSLPPLKDEIQPDIVVSSWLKNTSTRKYFKSLDFMFSGGLLEKNAFYEKLLDYGVLNSKQYLLPVSFNLSAVMFSKKNEELVTDDHILTLDAIKKLSSDFNEKNEDGNFIKMGFAPSWDGNFLYLASRLDGAAYKQSRDSFSWDEEALQKTAAYMKEWTASADGSSETEQNFQFKYLYMPEYRQVASDRCFFAYIRSDNLFMLTEEQSSGLTFRWVGQNEKLLLEDDFVTMGIFKGSKHNSQSQKFVEWFFKEETQKKLLERHDSLKTDSNSFGVAGGFSSLRKVNSKIFPLHYRSLLENLPTEKFLEPPSMLGSRWQSLKERVVIPYLKDLTSFNPEEDKELQIKSMQKRISDWERLAY